MDKHVIVIEYIGGEPNLEAVRAAIEGIGQHVQMSDQKISPIVLDEHDIAKALYIFGLVKGVDARSPLSIEIKRKKTSKKSLVDAIIKALNDVEDV